MRLMGNFRSRLSRLTCVVGRHSQSARHISSVREENRNRYCEGGYHPVRIGDVFHNNKYEIVSKLGYGIYSTVWLAFDLESKCHVAVKILTADSVGSGTDTFELEILKQIKDRSRLCGSASHVLELLDDFEHSGPNGQHKCLVFKAMGPDLSKYRQLFPGLKVPLTTMKNISKQLLLSLVFLHDSCRVIHTDIKPQNILIETDAIEEMFQKAPPEAFQLNDSASQPEDAFYMESIQLSSAEEDLMCPVNLRVKLGDFGTASWFDKHLTEWIQPQKLRASEVILGSPWDYKVDIWNLGLVIWELAQGQLLFDGLWTADANYTPEAHLAQMAAIFGNMPRQLLNRSKNQDRYFDSQGDLILPSTFPPRSLEDIDTIKGVSETERSQFLSFIKAMTQLDPKERPDASKLLKSPWLS